MKKIIILFILIMMIPLVFGINNSINSFFGKPNPLQLNFTGGNNLAQSIIFPNYAYINDLTLHLFAPTFENVTISTSSLTSYWSFDDSASDNSLIYDVHSASHNLTMNTNHNGVPSNWSQTKYCNGTSVFNSSTISSSMTNTVGTLSFWVKPNGTNNNNYVIGMVNQGATPDRFYFKDSGGAGFSFVIGRTPITTTAVPLESNNWTFITFRWNDTDIYVYHDAVLKADTPDGNWQSITGDMYLCANQIGVPKFNGSIDEFAIFDRNLTDTEIVNLYNGGLGYQYNTSFNQFPSNLYINTGDAVNNDWSLNTSLIANINVTFDSDNLISKVTACNCTGCSLSGNNCTVPFIFNSDTGGTLTVNMTNNTYEFGVDNCTTFQHPIINLTYKDQTDSTIISIDNNYDLNLFYPFSQTLQGTYTNLQKTGFCSRSNNSGFDYNFSGDMTVSKSLYGTQILEYTPVNSLAGLYPASLYDIFLPKLENTSTILFTWRTNTFENVDGTMEVYECQGDGSRSLISSTSIINGEVAANLELLTKSYSYEVIFEGARFTDADSYTKCHIETQTTRLYILKVGEPTAPITGIYSIPCNLTRTGNFSFSMVWGANPESDSVITGCVNAYRQTVRGDTEIYEECSTTSGISATVSDSGFTYIVKGRLFQNGFNIGCQNQLEFETATQKDNTFGLMGILSIFFLIAGVILLFANQKPKWYPLMGVFGIIFAWVLGILAFGWLGVSSLVFFVVIIILIGRHSKKT